MEYAGVYGTCAIAINPMPMLTFISPPHLQQSTNPSVLGYMEACVTFPTLQQLTPCSLCGRLPGPSTVSWDGMSFTVQLLAILSITSDFL